MKASFWIGLLLAQPLSAADYAAWTHRQTLEITQPGLQRLDLDPALLDAARGMSGAPFHDLRLVNPAGVEMPYVVLQPVAPEAGTRQTALDFKQSLRDTTTVLEFLAPPGNGAVSGISLSTPTSNFIKAASLEASTDGTNWQPLTRNELICHQPGIERLSLRFTAGAWTHFRLLVEDLRTSPVAFSSANIYRESVESVPVTVPHAVTIKSREERAGETYLRLDLGAANLRLATLRLLTPEPVFQRRVTVLGIAQTIFRLQHEGHSAEEIEVPLHQLAEDREIELVIDNESNPPLRIDSFELTRYPSTLLFQADAPGAWQLFAGNAQAEAPRYDIATLTSQLRQAAASKPKASVVAANATFRKDATAPAVGASGSTLDVSAWARRRVIEFREAGIVEVELDPEVLAHAARDFADLRVIRDGQQVPYLLKQSSDTREVDASFELIPDAKRSSMSVWKVRMPFIGYPVHEITLESDTPLFERHVQLSESWETVTRDGPSFVPITFLWIRQPNQQPSPLRFSISSRPAGDTFIIETDNGDNAPLNLSRVRLKHPVTRVWFRAADTSPVHLYYAQSEAAAPRYDLSLVRTEFEKATKISGTLGASEPLRVILAPRSPSTSGGPLLWATLALVVGGLLWVIRRLLPNLEVPGNSP
jgi:hypothetical protein